MTTEPSSSTPDYTMGYGQEIIDSFRRYTAQSHAAYMYQHLRPGQRLLDFGCGPGSISVGLARAISPGEFHGVDIEESQLEIARKAAEIFGLENMQFHLADAVDLPFENEYFDVAHCHNLLMHVPDTAAVLEEVKRVLRPGGLIACSEMICDSSFTQPDFGVIGRAWDMFADLLAADDGHPQMGRELKGHLVDAGFANIKVTGSFDTYSTSDEIKFIHNIVGQWFLAPEITEAAIKYGATSETLIQQIHEAYEKWKDHPGALCSLAVGEAIANKP